MSFTSKPRLVIDLSAMDHNFKTARRLAGEAVEVSAVVKSNAYGLGLDIIALSLAGAGCRSFFVADLDEAVRLRRRLPDADIFVLAGYRPCHKHQYRRDRLVPVCNRLLEARAASSEGLPYAMNLETGFSRFGLTHGEICRFVHLEQSPPVLVMSHLACADDSHHPLNALQRDRFIGMAGMLGNVRRSLGASSAIALGAPFRFDQVRIGSAIFGINNANLHPKPFLPVVRLRARIVDTRLLQAGATIGYMATSRAARPTRIAIIAAGYSHGVPWSLANRISVEIGSHRAPVLGRVSMECVAIDVTDIPAGVGRPGDWVELISASQPIEAVAALAETIPQEIMIRIGRSCQRVYCRQSVGVQA